MDFLLELLAEIAGEVLSVILEFVFKRIKSLKKESKGKT